MTNLEHIIENTMLLFEANKSYEEILDAIVKDVNYVDQPMNKDEIYAVCQYFWRTYLDNGNGLVKAPMQPTKDRNNDYFCPACGKKLEFARFHPTLIQHHCTCGQAIDWGKRQ